MIDSRVAQLAGRQFNRVSKRQLLALGLSAAGVDRRIACGRYVRVEEGVVAIAPVLDHDRWGHWMAAALTEPATFVSRLSASVAWAMLSMEGDAISVTRPGSGGPQRFGGVVVYRSSTLPGDTTTLNGIPITTPARTLLDIAGVVSDRALARAIREAFRLKIIDAYAFGDALGRYRGRRGARRLALSYARYRGLPLEHARSGAEIRAMELIRDAGLPMPRLNVKVAKEEADLSWPDRRLIIEIDGGPFHQDKGEDARKEAAWKAAGWTIRRLSSDDVYENPQRLIALAR